MTTAAALLQPNWYVIQTKPKQEFRALEQLQNQSYNCFLPTLNVEKIRRGKIQTVMEPLFARYLFIQLDRVASNWAPLRSTRGVSNLLTFGGRFATIPDLVVEALRTEVERQQQARLFRTGEKVVIGSGPFTGFEGIYQMTDGDARALVLLELIHQPQQLRFEMEMLRKAA